MDRIKRKVIVTLSADITSRDLASHQTRNIHLDETKSSVAIGRSSHVMSKGLNPQEDNAWFDSPVMSRNHAEIVADLDHREVQIRDTGSRHGTFVNGGSTGFELRPLHNGDSICFGGDVIRGETIFPPTTVKVHFAFQNGEPTPTSARPGTYRAPSPGYEMSENYDESDVEEDGQAAATFARPTMHTMCSAVPRSSGTTTYESMDLPSDGSHSTTFERHMIDLTNDTSEKTGIARKMSLSLSRQTDLVSTGPDNDHAAPKDVEQTANQAIAQDRMEHRLRRLSSCDTSIQQSTDAESDRGTANQAVAKDRMEHHLRRLSSFDVSIQPSAHAESGRETADSLSVLTQLAFHPDDDLDGVETESSMCLEDDPICLDSDEEDSVVDSDDVSDNGSIGSSVDGPPMTARENSTHGQDSYDTDDDDGDDLFNDIDSLDPGARYSSDEEEEKFQEGELNCDVRSDVSDSGLSLSENFSDKPSAPVDDGVFRSTPTSRTAHPPVTIEALLNRDVEDYFPSYSRNSVPWNVPSYSLQSRPVTSFPEPYGLPIMSTVPPPEYATQPPIFDFGSRTEALVQKTGKSDFFAAREENKTRFKPAAYETLDCGNEACLVSHDVDEPSRLPPTADGNIGYDAPLKGKRKADDISEATKADEKWVAPTSNLDDGEVLAAQPSASGTPSSATQEVVPREVESTAETPSSATQEAVPREAEVPARPSKRTRYGQFVRGVGLAALGGLTISTVVFGSLVHVSPDWA